MATERIATLEEGRVSEYGQAIPDLRADIRELGQRVDRLGEQLNGLGQRVDGRIDRLFLSVLGIGVLIAVSNAGLVVTVLLRI